jgi:uncharacterized membrane protein (DUF106 family)
MNNKNILTVALISIAVLLAILGIFYYSFGGPRVDEVTMQQAEADSLRNVLRETQQKLNEEQKQNQKANLTPTLTLEQQQAKLEKELLLKERSKPLDYLSLSYDHTYRWFISKEEYSGFIYNKAKQATFMNFDIRVTFLSKTKTSLGSKVFKVYEYCHPMDQVSFKIQTTAPSGYQYHEVEIIRAVPHQPELSDEYEPNEQR